MVGGLYGCGRGGGGKAKEISRGLVAERNAQRALEKPFLKISIDIIVKL